MASRASWLGSGTTLIAKALFVARLVVQLLPVLLDWRKVLYANPDEAVGVVLLAPLLPHFMSKLSDESTRAYCVFDAMVKEFSSRNVYTPCLAGIVTDTRPVVSSSALGCPPPRKTARP